MRRKPSICHVFLKFENVLYLRRQIYKCNHFVSPLVGVLAYWQLVLWMNTNNVLADRMVALVLCVFFHQEKSRKYYCDNNCLCAAVYTKHNMTMLPLNVYIYAL